MQSILILLHVIADKLENSKFEERRMVKRYTSSDGDVWVETKVGRRQLTTAEITKRIVERRH